MKKFLTIILFWAALTDGGETLADGFVVTAEGYPAGFISTLSYEWQMSKQHSSSAHIGLNYANRRDLGENDDENGLGYGGGLQYRYHFFLWKEHFFAGARVDFWSLEIDWREGSEKGTTETLVLQPTAELGYHLSVSDSYFVRFAGAFGSEINIVEDGQQVGEGPIGLARISFGSTF